MEAAGGTRFVAGIALVLDGLSRVFLLVIAVVSTAVVIFGFRYLEAYTGRPLFYTLFNLLVAGMCGTVLAGDLFNLFVFLEVASIASYALVAFGTGRREVEAAFKYVLLGALASTAILLGIGTLYASDGLPRTWPISRWPCARARCPRRSCSSSRRCSSRASASRRP